MSEDARNNTTRWLTHMWDNYLNDISTQRKKANSQLVPAPETMLSELRTANGNMAQYALSNGLVHVITSSHQYELEFADQNEISIYDYQLKSENKQVIDDNQIGRASCRE